MVTGYIPVVNNKRHLPKINEKTYIFIKNSSNIEDDIHPPPEDNTDNRFIFYLDDPENKLGPFPIPHLDTVT